MKEGLNFKIEDYDKFPELIKLWNNWLDKTVMLSNGNCEVEEWDALVAYGKDHVKEVAEFIYDKFKNNLDVSWPEMSLLDSCLDEPLIKTNPGQYISSTNPDIQAIYRNYCALICGKTASAQNEGR